MVCPEGPLSARRHSVRADRRSVLRVPRRGDASAVRGALLPGDHPARQRARRDRRLRHAAVRRTGPDFRLKADGVEKMPANAEVTSRGSDSSVASAFKLERWPSDILGRLLAAMRRDQRHAGANASIPTTDGVDPPHPCLRNSSVNQVGGRRRDCSPACSSNTTLEASTYRGKVYPAVSVRDRHPSRGSSQDRPAITFRSHHDVQLQQDTERARQPDDRVYRLMRQNWRTGITQGARMVSNVLRDARYSLRQLRKSPGFSVVAILTLAIGIGAASAMFSVVNGVILRPLPYPQSETLVRVVEIVPQFGRFSVAPATFLDWRAQNAVFERIAAYSGGSGTFVDASGPERLASGAVSWDLFELLRVAPALGRGFRPEEDMPGKANVIVLSHSLWQRRFGGDPGVLGRSISLNGAPCTIVGVMPAGFSFPSRQIEYWMPIALNPANATRGGHFLGVVARLKQGVTVARADAEMRTISERLALQYPDASAKES